MIREHTLRFSMHVYHTYGLPHGELMRIVKAKNRYTARYRAAALRHLVHAAPLSVTDGRPFAARRRRVRAHYNI